MTTASLLGAVALGLLTERRMVVSVASRDAGLQPHLALGLGYRLVGDGSFVEIVLDAERAAAVLADLRDNGHVAAVFSEPSTHCTLQIKGTGARLRDAAAADRALAVACRDAFADEILPLGFSADYARTTMHAGAALVVVGFAPAEVYEQTPGAQAGAPLRER